MSSDTMSSTSSTSPSNDKNTISTWGTLITPAQVDIIKSSFDCPFDKDSTSSDIYRFSTLHSWYKHLPRKSNDNDPNKIPVHEGDVFYPILMIGQQERNALDDTECDGKIHWHFMTPQQMHLHHSKIGSMRYVVALRHPVYLDNSFGNTYLPGDGQERLYDACKQIWENLRFQHNRSKSFNK